ncbi:MAG: Gfo/Idh/MocA family oxidoreductase, partial [Candidatus Puniceispirillaceae bacterium]
MYLYDKLLARAAAGQPVRVGLIGAGKFGSMVLSQAQHIKGMHVAAVADLDLDKAKKAFTRVGWDIKTCFSASASEAIAATKTWLTEDVSAVCNMAEIDCIIEATGHPLFGVRHALQAIESGKHVIMVNVEADILSGPYIAQKASERGVIYSMAYGDQPAAICELVDWVHSNGFELVAAGKGMNFQPEYRYST